MSSLANHHQRLSLPGAAIDFFPGIDLGDPPDVWLARLAEDLAWRSETITLFGKTMLQPRLLAWYGDPDAHYRYSGKTHTPLPWTDHLLALKARVEDATGARFNSVLANLYRDHSDSMGLHADDEPELGAQPVIASLSLGATRVFRLKHRHDRRVAPLKLPLVSGSLLVMAGDTQQNWKHEVPKQRVPCGPRINLTFRYVYPDR